MPVSYTHLDVYKRQLNTLQEERIADGTLRPEQKLKVAIIYSQGNGGQLFDTFGEEENFTFATEGTGNRMDGFLEDYNTMFGTNFSTDGDSFDNYYKDVSRKMKMRELDLLIVVNMFLTGFDSKTVNTLWVDKNLKMHGLVQAYSRTNRILNSLKPSGNIVCFRDLEQATKEMCIRDRFGAFRAAGYDKSRRSCAPACEPANRPGGSFQR